MTCTRCGVSASFDSDKNFLRVHGNGKWSRQGVCGQCYSAMSPTERDAAGVGHAQRRERVLKGDDRPSQPTLETPDLRAALADALARDTYLTAEEAALYVRRASLAAFYIWRLRHGVRAYGSRGKLLFTRKDLDEGLKPPSERGRRQHFGSAAGMRRTS